MGNLKVVISSAVILLVMLSLRESASLSSFTNTGEDEQQLTAEMQEELNTLLPITITNIYRGSGSVNVDYTIKNNTNNNFESLFLKLRCTLYDENNQPITSRVEYAPEVPAGELKESMFLIIYSGTYSSAKITFDSIEQ